MVANQPCKDLLERVRTGESITPNNRKGLEDFLNYETPGSCLFTKWTYPPIIERGKNNKVWDVDGREYIDCITGMSSMNIGHADPRVAEVLKTQYMKLSHWFDFPTPERLKLARRLCEITPGDFPKKVWLGLSGADGLDAVLRLVRYHTKKTQIISFLGGYHGQNIGTMGLTTKAGMHRWYNPVPPADHGINRFPYPYTYRDIYGNDSDPEKCARACVEAIDKILCGCENTMANYPAGINNVAAIIVEPLQCSAGYIRPHDEFLRGLRRLADKHGILLVFDEIQSGMGRTGTMWGCEHSGVVPDIIVVGKALGGGVPMSAVVGRAEIFDDLAPGMSSNTYAGYALGCAVANKVLDIIEEDKLLERCRKTGKHMEKVAKEYAGRHPLVGTYDQVGVFLGIEYVRDEKKTPALEETIALCDALMDAGLLAQRNGYYGNRMSFLPTITIYEKDVDEMFAVIDKATTEIEKRFNIAARA
ncbi:MAG: aspartate aminotransferase family protein [Planctomycetota bacterium]|jgi:4-aminobutyrate aminotransferase-like enzyme|nr:aspartate aminotransferase family protein [Planctomycetota bacterium]